MLVNQPKIMKAREVPLPPSDGRIGWPSQKSAGGLTLVVQIRERQQADQLSTRPGPQSRVLNWPTPKSASSVNC